jgi:hypothetical protein
MVASMRMLDYRYALVAYLMHTGRPGGISDFVAELQQGGFDLGDYPPKFVSDLLRTEIANGRVVRLRRGVYGLGRMPESTARYIRRSARTLPARRQARADLLAALDRQSLTRLVA